MFLVHNNSYAIGVYNSDIHLDDFISELNDEATGNNKYKYEEVKEITFIEKILAVTLNDANLTEITLKLI